MQSPRKFCIKFSLTQLYRMKFLPYYYFTRQKYYWMLLLDSYFTGNVANNKFT